MPRRLFLKLILTIAPFVGSDLCEATAVPAPAEPPREQDIERNWLVGYDPFDLILAEAMGWEVKATYPKDHIYVNGLGWVPKEHEWASDGWTEAKGTKRWIPTMESEADTLRISEPERVGHLMVRRFSFASHESGEMSPWVGSVSAAT